MLSNFVIGISIKSQKLNLKGLQHDIIMYNVPLHNNIISCEKMNIYDHHKNLGFPTHHIL